MEIAPTAHPTRERSAITSITDLTPDAKSLKSNHIKAVVTLIWPYSSSTASLALLLAEPDFRLRTQRGQVRVQLRGSIAKDLAQIGIGIGDRVVLDLDDAFWESSPPTVSTPGRSIEADLVFQRRISLRIDKGDGNEIEVDITGGTAMKSTPPDSPPHLPASQPLFVTPVRPRAVFEDSNTWQSPRFVVPSSNRSASFVSSQDISFADEGDFFDGRKAKRTKFGRRSGEWRFEALSPPESPDGAQSEDVLEADAVPAPAEDLDGQAAAFPTSSDTQPLRVEPPESSQLEKDLALDDMSAVKPLQDPVQESLPGTARETLPETAQDSIPDDSHLLLESVLEPAQKLLQEHAPVLDIRSSSASPEPKAGADTVKPMSPRPNDFTTETRLSTSPEAATTFALPPIEFSSSIADNQDVTMEVDDQPLRLDLHHVEELPSSDRGTDQTLENTWSPFGLDGSVFSRAREPEIQAGDISAIHGENVIEDEDQTEPLAISVPPLRSSGLFGFAVQDLPAEAPRSDMAPEALPEDQIRPVSPETPLVVERDVQSDNQGGGQDIFEEFLLSSPTKDRHSLSSDKQVSVEHDLQPPLDDQHPASLPSVPASGNLVTPSESQEAPTIERSSSIHPVDQILNARLPITPAPSRSNLSDMLIEQRDSPSHRPNATTDQQSTQKEERRRSSRLQSKDVPEAVSPWFSSRKSSAQKPSAHKQKRQSLVERVTLEQHQDRQPPQPLQPVDVVRQEQASISSPPAALSKSGYRTKHSYYAPLASLETYMAASSSQGAVTLDVFGVVMSPTSTPVKAKAGPRDYSVTLKVTDLSISTQKVQVQCFRAFSESLPQADIGDVVILRDFVVKSRKNQCFLLSADPSAWHVWRYRHTASMVGVESEDAGSGPTRRDSPVEECRGPPLEIGEEEQEYARTMHQWWQTLQPTNSDQ